MRLRPNVAAIVQNRDGLILIGERGDIPGAWQFPQGGVNDGESLEEALARELEEELALAPGRYAIGDSKGPYEYLFGEGKTKRGFAGQRQHYFRVLVEDEAAVDPETPEPEFVAVKWIRPESYRLDWLPAFKREVYRAVFRDFFGVDLAG
jgi:putative (di)nucleoside polyphosphate hydrolase